MRLFPIAVPILLLMPPTILARADEPSKPDAPRPSARAEDVFSESEGERVIVYIVPEGTHVAKGQVVCVLDAISAPLGLETQRITTAQAEASYQQAKLTREVAEMAAVESEKGVFRQDLETSNGNLAMAQAEMKRAEDRLAWSRRMHQKRFVSEAQLTSDKLNLDKARFTLEQAQTNQAVLLKYVKDKSLKELRSEVEKARADEMAKKATLDVERSKAKGLERQARPGVVLAPADGTVVLARPTRLVEVGAEVCKDQLLLRIVPPGK